MQIWRKGTNCSFPNPNMCCRFIRSGNKGSCCQYAHPKLCMASLTSKRCARNKCYYYNVAGTSRPLTDISTHYNNASVPVHRQFNSKPTSIMQIDVPFLHNPISTLPQNVPQFPPKTQVPTPKFMYPFFLRTAEGTENANDPITAN